MRIIQYFKHRRLLNNLRQIIREAQHVRNLREDIADSQLLRRLETAQQQALDRVASRDWPVMEAVGRELADISHQIYPPHHHSALRENIEILLVAVAVAMAFRTYFIQPFKIPTASMAPTLSGIHFTAKAWPDISDRYPLNLIKWLVWGEWYVEVRAKTTGRVSIEPARDGRYFVINGICHPVKQAMSDHVTTGDMVVKGQLLASGMRTTGDHIFVDKVSWNFRKPGRGKIMVFKTTGINHPQIKTNEHYVKRMVGLPREILQIQPPYLVIDGEKTVEPYSIARVESQQDGYDGYQLGGNDYRVAEYLAQHSNNVMLGKDQYFACGDNQFNSLDSRYWGPVPKKNLVGPAFFVYWPFSRHWGFIQ